MAYSITNTRNDLSGLLHGTGVDKIRNFYALLWRAARDTLAKVDPAETKRIAEVTVYDGIYDYGPPADLKADKIIDIRPQASRGLSENINHVSNEEFDLYKGRSGGRPRWTVEFDDAVKILRIDKSLTGNLLVHDMDGLTSNGTWAAGTGGSAVALDQTFKTQGGGSIRFSVSATGGAIENSTFTAVDLTTHDERSSWFLRLYLPDSTLVTDVRLRWGNSSSVFWSRTVTTPHLGSFKNGWQWVRFDWNGATETGAVDPAAIDYLLVTVTTTAADTDIRVDEIRSILGEVHEVLYYSKILFRSSSGAFKEEVTVDTDLVNLDSDSFNLFLYECARVASQQLFGADAANDLVYYSRVLDDPTGGLYARYKFSHPQESQHQRNRYYRIL